MTLKELSKELKWYGVAENGIGYYIIWKEGRQWRLARFSAISDYEFKNEEKIAVRYYEWILRKKENVIFLNAYDNFYYEDLTSIKRVIKKHYFKGN